MHNPSDVLTLWRH